MVVVIVGGGWAGCAAAYSARAAGARTVLLEKTDMLLGTGLVGGIMRNNGRFTALEEVRALGAGDFIRVIEEAATHRRVDFPGHRHAMLYDVTRIEPAVKNLLLSRGVQLKLQKRVVSVAKQNNLITDITTADGETVKGDVYVDCTGTAGPAANCTRFGTGCAMCILRCPTFGPRVSFTASAGVEEIRAGEGFPHFEAMSGSCKLDKKSLAAALVKELENKGVLVMPLPPHLQKAEQLARKACQQYATSDFFENLIILDTGHAKLMTPYFPLEILRTLDGFKDARYADPYSGGRGNSVRFMAIAPCDDSLRVPGVANLFCAGEKTGLIVGHTEAIVTGFLAGHNAVRLIDGKEPLSLPAELACGDIISYMHEEMKTPAGLGQKYTFSGSVYFQRMRDLGLYTTDAAAIKEKVARTGLAGVFKKRLLD
ncbi:FAD-dependent oxidoreductase [Pelotomaculum propionicicum]|uniref:Methylenetetrahydrofolate--tRNA-(Uracil-5-)-methyltransferase TrmFO n=1 Tax=Pelotomaculum propionicicum TaxID=258475 RepID=A0A4Y7RSY2_9FIRM|nr:FAD-dependent oxidoreductase [Pelotomaculum propionicicum]NLI13060.1 FAD-dependent oxidoreductase [Peptococcaceae bacterium]TEB11839.1 Methylenetetrahydrofolate--tRNA-(uracil-5-)-methyltransferase TrmFO [Pelotomaculum propionicicum]